MPTTRPAIDRAAARAAYTRNRARTAWLYDLLADDAYYARPIDLRHPVVFYEGHLPAFSLNTLVKRALGRPGVDEGLEGLFARGIDPDEADADGGPGAWPDRARVRAFVEAADARVADALATAELDVPGHPLLDGAQAVHAILEHEAMHHETLLYMWHRLPYGSKRPPREGHRVVTGPGLPQAPVTVPAGVARLGARRGSLPFGWDNEYEEVEVRVPAFSIDRRDVTNGDYLRFVEDAGATPPSFWDRAGGAWWWRGMFEPIPLPLDWPVYATHDEASAYAAWRGARLPTEAEFHRAAYGSPDGEPRTWPWGDAPPDPSRGVFDFSSFEPEPVGTHPAGASAWGVHDLVGNGWEWTSTLFRPFPGFAPLPSYPEYSADFFDDAHYVMKGASPATARALLRPSFRNWFRPQYPYVYATFRCVRDP